MMIKTVLLSVFALFAQLMYAQTNYYVSPSGNNINNGLAATPWKTIQHGVDNLHDADTLNVSSGTFNEKINITRSNIYIRNAAGATPLLSGSGIVSQVAMLQVINQSNITIDGLEIANNVQTDAQGILVEGNCKNISIKNCKVHDIHFSANPAAAVNENTNAQGIIVYGSNGANAITNLKILNNSLYNCRLGYSEGIAVNGNVDGFEISGNQVHDLTNIGIDAIGHEGTSSSAATDQARNGIIKKNIVYNCLSKYATSGGIYVDGGKNIVIENNTSYHNGYGVELGCENPGTTTDSIIVRNNIFYNNEVCAMALGGYDYPGGSGKVINCTVTNNTCYKNDYLNDGNGELYLSYSENTRIVNNIFYLSAQNKLAYAELGQPSLHFNYNLFFSDNSPADMEADWNGHSYTSFTAFKTGTGSNANSSIGNPLFVNASIVAPDFHIGAASTAKEAGDPMYIPAITERDMDGELRVSGIVDCGTDEYYNPTLIYTFTGNGNWSLASNWLNNLKPPTTVSGNTIIVIDPAGQGECILNAVQYITNNAQLRINPGKKFSIVPALSVHQ